MATENRTVNNFDKVFLRGYGELTITQSGQESLEIQAEEDLLAKIKTEVVDSTLRIDVIEDWVERIGAIFSRGFESSRIRYNLSVKNLSGLNIHGAGRVKINSLNTGELALALEGAGEISIDALQAHRLSVNFPGAGSIRIQGKVDEQSVLVAGAGAYQARSLESKDTTVTIAGVGKATVWAVENLKATLNGLGSIDYYGNPQVQRTIMGLGTINEMGNQ